MLVFHVGSLDSWGRRTWIPQGDLAVREKIEREKWYSFLCLIESWCCMSFMFCCQSWKRANAEEDRWGTAAGGSGWQWLFCRWDWSHSTLKKKKKKQFIIRQFPLSRRFSPSGRSDHHHGRRGFERYKSRGTGRGHDGEGVRQSAAVSNSKFTVVKESGLIRQNQEQTHPPRPLESWQAAASAGDGYRGRRSPHTPHETFEGLTVLRAVKVSEQEIIMGHSGDLMSIYYLK